MKKVLITGAAGFVGAVLARRLVEEGQEVHLLLRPEGDPWRLAGIDAPRHAVDLTDEKGVADTLERVRPEWVFHLAAHGAYSWQTDLRRIVETNLLGTMRLVRASLSLGFEAFVNAGSSSEYGFTDHPPRESEPLRPNSDYALSKAAASLFCCDLAVRHRAPLVTLRLYSAYGPYEEPSRLLPTLAVLGLEGKLPPLVSPKVARDFVFVEDVAAGFVLAAENAGREPGAVYNLGTGRQVTLREAVAVAQRTLGIEVEPEWQSMPDRAWDTKTWVADASKIRRELGWKPRVTFEEGFRRLVSWLEENPALRARYRERLLSATAPPPGAGPVSPSRRRAP